MSKYTEVEGKPNDPEGLVLEALADGMPYAFIVATELAPLKITLSSQYGPDVVRALLQQTLKALP